MKNSSSVGKCESCGNRKYIRSKHCKKCHTSNKYTGRFVSLRREEKNIGKLLRGITLK